MKRTAYSPELQSELAHGKYTKWAADLTEAELYNLLWLVGEFGVRTPEDSEGPVIGASHRRAGARWGIVQYVRCRRAVSFQRAIRRYNPDGSLRKPSA